MEISTKTEGYHFSEVGTNSPPTLAAGQNIKLEHHSYFQIKFNSVVLTSILSYIYKSQILATWYGLIKETLRLYLSKIPT